MRNCSFSARRNGEIRLGIGVAFVCVCVGGGGPRAGNLPLATPNIFFT